jgi:DNA-binding NarL/FixJ family response regulator
MTRNTRETAVPARGSTLGNKRSEWGALVVAEVEEDDFSARVTVVIADSDEARRHAIAMFLAQDRTISDIHEADAADGLFELVSEFRPDVVALDSGIGKSVTEMIHGIKDRAADARIIVIADRLDVAFERELQRAGAWACLTRTASAMGFLELVQESAFGKDVTKPF